MQYENSNTPQDMRADEILKLQTQLRNGSNVGININPVLLQQEFARNERSKQSNARVNKAQQEDAVAYKNAVAHGYEGAQRQFAVPDVYKVNVANTVGVSGSVPIARGLADLYGSANGRGDTAYGIAAKIPLGVNHDVSAFAERGNGAYSPGGEDTTKAGLKYRDNEHSVTLGTNRSKMGDDTNLSYNYSW